MDILRLLVQYATFNMCDLLLLRCVLNAKRTKEGREEKIVHSTDEILTKSSKQLFTDKIFCKTPFNKSLPAVRVLDFIALFEQ